jgi:Tfp pilus assembly protein PilE
MMEMKKLNRRGLTLLELVVVLTILIALAGILVPLLPGMLRRAHTSTGATNMGEIVKIMETVNLVDRGYPDGYDSLMDDNGLYELLPGYDATGGGTACGTELVTTTLDGDEQVLLAEAGVTILYGMDEGTDNATFEPYSSTDDITIDDSGSGSDVTVAALSAAAALRLFNDNTADRYVVFGLGAQSTIVGREGIANAPVHFGAGEAGPEDEYSRFGVVFDVTADPAEFVGAVAFHGNGLGTIDEAVSGWYAGHDH